MIEVNLKAKPFNPAEDVVGSEILWMMNHCQLVGRHYYLDTTPQKKGRTVIGMPLAGRWSKVLKVLTTLKWEAAPNNVEGFYRYLKEENSLYLTQDPEYYYRWRDASEACKLLGLSDIEEHHKLAEQMHMIIVQGFKVEVNKEGELVKVTQRPEEHPQEPPVDPGWGQLHQPHFAVHQHEIAGAAWQAQNLAGNAANLQVAAEMANAIGLQDNPPGAWVPVNGDDIVGG